MFGLVINTIGLAASRISLEGIPRAFTSAVEKYAEKADNVDPTLENCSRRRGQEKQECQWESQLTYCFKIKKNKDQSSGE